MKVLVTGAGGAVGRRLVASLHNHGTHQVSAVLSPRAPQPYPGEFAVDVADATAFRAVLQKVRPDAVVHLAGLTGSACTDNPDRAAAVNTASTTTLVSAADDFGIQRLVFASTSAVYGDAYSAPVDESGPCVPMSVYAHTKYAAELELVKAESAQTVCLRVFNVFGPGLSGSLVNRLQASTALDPVQLRGLDCFARDYIHVDDVVDALESALVSTLPAQHFLANIGSGVATSNRDLLARLAPAAHGSIVEPQDSYSCADITAAGQWLGFHPTRRISTP